MSISEDRRTDSEDRMATDTEVAPVMEKPTKPTPEQAAAASGHGERPTARTVLPWRAFHDTFAGIVLECEVVYPDGQRAPGYRLVVGNPDDPQLAWASPSAKATYDLIQMFFALETKVDAVAKDRDEALSQVALMRGELASVIQSMEIWKKKAEEYKDAAKGKKTEGKGS